MPSPVPERGCGWGRTTRRPTAVRSLRTDRGCQASPMLLRRQFQPGPALSPGRVQRRYRAEATPPHIDGGFRFPAAIASNASLAVTSRPGRASLATRMRWPRLAQLEPSPGCCVPRQAEKCHMSARSRQFWHVRGVSGQGQTRHADGASSISGLPCFLRQLGRHNAPKHQ